MVRPRRGPCRLAGALLGFALHCVNVGVAQEAPLPSVHWAYATYFGTGWYQVADQQSAFIVNYAPRVYTAEADWPAAEDRKAVYTLRVPFALGVTRLDLEDVPGLIDPDNFAAVSAGVRADIDMPLTGKFSLRPSAQLSYGTLIGESDYAWTYRGDLRGRYSFRPGALDWSVIGAAGLVGYDANRGDDDGFTYAALGAEFAYPVPWFGSDDDQTLFHWHILYTDFLDRMEVRGRLNQLEEVTNFWQAGFAFGKRDRPIKLWFLRFDRLGLAYDVSPSGELRGLKIVMRSLYEP